MDPILAAVLVFIIGFAASFIGGIASGAGLISIPLLTILGLPPHMAIATNKVGMLGMKVGAFIKYVKTKKVIWSFVVPLSVLSILGAIIGANVLVSLDKALLSRLVGVFVLLLLPMVFFRKDAGIKRKMVSRAKKGVGYFFYLLVAIWSAFFGGGSGFFFIYTFIYFFGTTVIECKATNKVPSFFLDATAILVFILYGIVNYLYAIILLVAMLLGGYVGAHVGIKKGDAWVKTVMAIVIVISAIKLIFF